MRPWIGDQVSQRQILLQLAHLAHTTHPHLAAMWLEVLNDRQHVDAELWSQAARVVHHLRFGGVPDMTWAELCTALLLVDLEKG